MANKNKTTKRDYFNTLLSIPEVAADDALVAFIEHELDLLDKKNAASRKPTAKQTAKRNEDAALREAIVAEMEPDTLYSAADLLANLPTLAATDGMTVAKVSFLMRELVALRKVERVVEKRHTFYKVA